MRLEGEEKSVERPLPKVEELTQEFPDRLETREPRPLPTEGTLEDKLKALGLGD
jgi:hypothetical protein